MRKAADQLAAKPAAAAGADMVPPLQLPPRVDAAAPFPTAAQPALPLGTVQILTGSNIGKTLDLTKSLTTLGKPGIQVAVIARRPHGYFLTHVEGARYPLANGVALNTQAYALKDHDVIELAGVKMEFLIRS
jgi:hypothetical protein